MTFASVEYAGRIMHQAEGSVLFLGAFNATAMHKNALPCVVFGLERPVRYENSYLSLEADAILVLPDVDHKIDYQGGRGAALYFEGPTLRARSEASVLGACSVGLPLVQYLHDHAHAWSGEATDNVIRGLCFDFPAPDERIQTIGRMVAADPSHRLSQTEGARIAGLERTTFLRRFRRATGMTFRAHKLWHATKLAVRSVEAGSSIETAALDSGFYDAPHFSRSFKKTFGLSPGRAQL